MKKNYITLIALALGFTIQAQVMNYKLSHMGLNAGTGNHEVALIATPNFTATDGNSADLGAVVSISGGGYLLPGSTGFVNDCVFTPPATNTCDYAIPASEWDATYLADPSTAAGTFVYQLLRVGGVENVFFDAVAGTEIIMGVFQVAGTNNMGDIVLIDNNDPILNGTPNETWLNINYPSIAGGTIDLYGSSDFTPVLFSILSTENIELNNVEIYPNPTDSKVNINGVSDLQSVELINMAGQRVQYIETAVEHMDMSHLQAGVYFMKITTKNGFATKRLVKQ